MLIQVHYVDTLSVEAVVLHFRLASSYPNLSHTWTVLCLDCKEILLAFHRPHFPFVFPRQHTSFTSTTNSLPTKRPSMQSALKQERTGRGFSQARVILTFPSGVPRKLFLLLQQSSQLTQSFLAEEEILKEMQAKKWFLFNKYAYLVLSCSSPFHQAHIMGSLWCPGLPAIGNLQENKNKSQNQILFKYS